MNAPHLFLHPVPDDEDEDSLILDEDTGDVPVLEGHEDTIKHLRTLKKAMQDMKHAFAELREGLVEDAQVIRREREEAGLPCPRVNVVADNKPVSISWPRSWKPFSPESAKVLETALGEDYTLAFRKVRQVKFKDHITADMLKAAVDDVVWRRIQPFIEITTEVAPVADYDEVRAQLRIQYPDAAPLLDAVDDRRAVPKVRL